MTVELSAVDAAMRDAIRRPRIGIGTITPSSNATVELVTTAVLSDFPDAVGHYSRIPIVGAAEDMPPGYDDATMVQCATLLSHVKPAALCWNGTKGGSIGFQFDRDLCATIEAATGIRTTTATLAIDLALRANNLRRIAFVTPYLPTYAAKLPPVFAEAGYSIVAEAHAGLVDNLNYGSMPDDQIMAMVQSVIAARPDVIIAFCTNMPAAHLADRIERETGIPFYDSASAGVWGALRAANQPTAPGRRWGSLFGQDLAV